MAILGTYLSGRLYTSAVSLFIEINKAFGVGHHQSQFDLVIVCGVLCAAVSSRACVGRIHRQRPDFYHITHQTPHRHSHHARDAASRTRTDHPIPPAQRSTLIFVFYFDSRSVVPFNQLSASCFIAVLR